MFSILKNLFAPKKPTVRFWTNYPGLPEIEPIVKGTQEIPKWMKSMPSKTSGLGSGIIGHLLTAKTCPGIVDYFSHAYVLKMWTDVVFTIEQRENGTYNFGVETPSNGNFKFDSHLREQYQDYIPQEVRDYNTWVVKAVSPWKLETPPGYSVLQLPMYYHYNRDFEVLPGVIDTDYHHEMNQQMMFFQPGKYTIKRGTPLCMFIPFKRQEYDLVCEEGTVEDEKNDFRSFLWVASKFGSGYRQKQKYHKEKNKQSKCPFGFGDKNSGKK